MPNKYPWDTNKTEVKQTTSKVVYPWDAKPSKVETTKPVKVAKPKKGQDLDWGADNAAMVTNKPKPMPKIQQIGTSNKGVPIIVNTKKFNQNSKVAGAATAGLVDSLTLGLGTKLMEHLQPGITEEARKDSPIAFEAGKFAGYTAPFAGAAKLAKPVVKGIAKPVLNKLAEGALAGGGITAVEDTIKGKGLKQTAKDVAINTALGAGADIALYGVGKLASYALSNIAKGKLNKIPIDTVTTALKPEIKNTTIKSQGAYKVKNTALEKAVNDYNSAIETIQSHFKTNELRADEVAKIKSELGIDLDSLVKNIENAEKGISVSKIGKQRNMANVAGVKTLPKIENPKLTKPTFEAPIIEEIPKNNTKILPKTETVITDELANNPTYKELTEELKNTKVTPDDNIKAMAPTIKDKSGLTLNLKDMYRNMRDIFGKSYEYVKKNYINPFDASKKAYADEVKKYTDDIYNKVVKGLGINKGTKESAAVQWYGEGVKVIDGKEVLYTKEDLIKDFGQEKANKIMEADKVFRQVYNELIDKVNATRKMIYPNNPEKDVLKRSNYYRHFNEMAEGFKGLKNIFETPSMIDPKLAGMSEFTKPNSRWASFMQKRNNGGYTADAVGGFLNYIQPAEYSIHIDPHIKSFRSLAKDIAEATQETKNANNTIKYLNDFANSLAGKTNKYDRVFQEDIPGGRTAFNAINWLNGRVKSNQVLMNAQSALSQFANVPVGVAKVKNPIAITQGVGQTLAGIVGKGNKAIAKSQFINERYIGGLLSRFDKKLTQQPKKFAAWLLEGADKLGTTFTWNSAYNKAVMNGVKDPVKYADDLARSIVAGRGIGEVPLMQQAKTFQLIAPFQLEVANLWHVLGDSVKEKDVAGIAMILLGNYLFNNATESLTGNRVTFDPVDAMVEALTEDETNAGKVAGRLSGEVLSNVPLGQTIAAMYPEYGADVSTPLGGVSLPSRKALFGDEDPTRFGGGLLVTKALTDPLYKVALPFGGAQAKKTIEGLQAVNKGMVAKNGKLSFPIKNSTENKLKAGLFGKYATKEAREYFDKDRRPLSEQQTKEILKQPDLKKAYEKKMAERRIETLKDKVKAIQKDETLSWTERQKKMSELNVQINALKLGL